MFCPHLCPVPVTWTLGCVELQHVTMLRDSYSFNCLAQPQVIQFVSQPSYYWGFNVPNIQKTIGWEHDAIYLEIKIQIRNSTQYEIINLQFNLDIRSQQIISCIHYYYTIHIYLQIVDFLNRFICKVL